jgi:hypothetical protein
VGQFPAPVWPREDMHIAAKSDHDVARPFPADLGVIRRTLLSSRYILPTRPDHDQGLGIVAWWLVYDRESGSLTGMRRRHGSKIMWVSNPVIAAEDRACLVIIPDQRRPGTAFTSAGQ